jgi:hypothetical protein
MPPLIQDRRIMLQELLLLLSAYSLMSLPSMPLQQQGYRNQQLLGISMPMGAGHASQPWSYDIAAQSSMPQTFCNQQGEQPPGLMWDHQYGNDIDAGQYRQLYQQENHAQFGALNQDIYTGQYLQQESGLFSDNTTQNNSV